MDTETIDSIETPQPESREAMPDEITTLSATLAKREQQLAASEEARRTVC